MGNVRIAIRDSTDAHSIGFFDNVAGIEYKSANLHRFLAGSASILTLKYSSKDIDTIRSGCKLAFRYKNRDYWLNIMDFSKKGYEVEIKAYSAGLELNNEKRGTHKTDRAMSFAEYLAYYDPEHSLELGVNEVADKRIKLEWTGTDTILSRLFSIANSFGAELEFTVELNQDYSLKRQILNVYKTGNLGSNRKGKPVRVGKELKVINYSDNIKNLRTAIRATGKDGLTIDGLNKKIYDDNNRLLYYSSGMTVYAPQSRDRFPSVGKKSNDNWIVEDLGETQYETKEALWAYMYGEIQKKSVPQITYDVEGAIDSDIGDTQTLIDDKHFEPGLYVQARVSELEEDILEEKVTKSTFINFERKYSQVASELIKQVEQLANDAAPYIIRLETNNGFNFKNGKGSSTVTASLEKYGKIVGASWQWIINNSVVSDKQSATINASQVVGTLNVVAVASVNGNEVAREYITFTNSDDGVGIKSIKRYYTTNDQAEGVTAGGQNWSTKPATVTADNKYMWSYDVITYTNDTSLVTEPAVIGARGDDGLDADTTGITEALDKAKQELTALSANIEKVRDDSLAAVEEAKQQLTTVANELSTAKQDLQTQASQLTAQASAQSELTKRVSSVEETANGTKTTVSELSKTVAQNGKDITSVTARTKTVEDDLSGTKTTLSQVKTTADSTSQKTATLETGLNGLNAKFDSLSVGNKNYLPASRVVNRGCSNFSYSNTSKSWTMTVPASSTTYGNGIVFNTSDLNILLNGGETLFFGLMIKANKTCSFNYDINNALSGTSSNDNDDRSKQAWSPSNKSIPANVWTRVWFSYTAKANVPITEYNSNFGIVNNTEAVTVEIKEVMVAKSNVPVDYQMPDADLEQKVAEYKQNADQNYASLQSTVQALDGTVTANKATAEQTAAGFKTRIESLETYKSGESTRANQYFESAKTETARQLTAERTAIAKDYVAKSTYTSDVTGIRNDLTATTTTANTTKTNLANYQASNDKVVANLQSNLQTANGNISSLQTKVEAVPGQITSAVSAVEGKIPTNVSTRNLILKSNDFANPHKQSGTNTTITSTDDYFVIKSTGYTANAWGGMSWNMSISEVTAGEEFSILMPVYIDSSIDLDSDVYFQLKNHPKNLTAYSYLIPKTQKDKWFNVAITFKITKDVTFDTYPFYVYLVKNGLVRIKPPMLVRGSLIPSDYQPAFEDTESDITKLSSELTQTKDGITLLATKTELNTAKSDLQSGITTATSKANTAQSTADNNAKTISTHTTQISALNTGLSAKVSQTDFNTLSGRVITAENNITAKANELSSKITSVEGKIPSGEMNLVEYGRPADGYSPYKNAEYATHPFYYNGAFKMYIIKNTTTSEKMLGMNRFKVERNTDYTLYFKGFNNSAITHMDVWFLKRVSGSINNFDSAQILVSSRKLSTSKAEDVSVTFNTGNYDEGYIRFDNNGSTTAGTQADLYFGDVSVKKGKSNNGWSPSLAELASSQDLKNAQSEIKQTTDSIKASVSSVQTTASNAQATANTAVSKADAAQSGVNALNETTVKTASLNLDNNGFVTKVGKTVNGNTFATMIAQNANNVKIIADEMQVTADMIVDGAVTAEKLDVNNLSAVNSDLGEIKGGSLLLQENKAAGSATDSWGTYNRPAYKQGLYMDNHAFASSGAIQRKNGGETTPTDMPLAVLQAGELRFLVVDYNDNLKNVVHYGLSDPDFGAIRFEIDSELKRRLTMTSSGYLNFQASNYTDWRPLALQGCEYMIQGRLVIVNYDMTFNSPGDYKLGVIPQEFTKKSLMMTAKAWTITPRDKNIQLNSDGSMHILDAEANVNYRGTLIFSY